MTVTTVSPWTISDPLYAGLPSAVSWGPAITTWTISSPLYDNGLIASVAWGNNPSSHPMLPMPIVLTPHLFTRDAEVVGVARPEAGQLYPRT